MPERASSKIINVSSVAEGWQDVRASRTCSLNTVPHFPHPFPTPCPPGGLDQMGPHCIHVKRKRQTSGKTPKIYLRAAYLTKP
jgi:hypothetical protein